MSMMSDKPEPDIYQLMGLAIVLTIAWAIQVVGFTGYRQELQDGPPQFNIVNMEEDFSSQSSSRDWDLKLPIVSKESAQEMTAQYQRKKWGSLALGVLAAFIVFFLAYRRWEDWAVAIACVIFGPSAMIWAFYNG